MDTNKIYNYLSGLNLAKLDKDFWETVNSVEHIEEMVVGFLVQKFELSSADARKIYYAYVKDWWNAYNLRKQLFEKSGDSHE